MAAFDKAFLVQVWQPQLNSLEVHIKIKEWANSTKLYSQQCDLRPNANKLKSNKLTDIDHLIQKNFSVSAKTLASNDRYTSEFIEQLRIYIPASHVGKDCATVQLLKSKSLTPGRLWNHEGTEDNGQSPVRTASPYLLNHCVCNLWTICGECHVLHATVKLKAARAHKTFPLEREGVAFIWYNLYFS